MEKIGRLEKELKREQRDKMEKEKERIRLEKELTVALQKTDALVKQLEAAYDGSELQRLCAQLRDEGEAKGGRY